MAVNEITDTLKANESLITIKVVKNDEGPVSVRWVSYGNKLSTYETSGILDHLKFMLLDTTMPKADEK